MPYPLSLVSRFTLYILNTMNFFIPLWCRNFFFALSFFSLSSSLEAQPYNFYYGNIHAHSGYSDGNIDSLSSLLHTPAQDYNYAKSSLHFDFLGISDHNHSGAGMMLSDYHLGVSQAQTANDDSVFVALYGMEYGIISSGGHLLVYGIDSLIGWQSGNYDIFCGQSNYSQLFGIVNAHPNAFASLAHPQTGDFGNLNGSAYSSTADSAITGTAIRSGLAFSTTNNYTDSPAPLYETYFKTLLSKGYHLGPSVDHDNHNTTFGRTLPGRTVVLASSLAKTAILSGLKASRYYASDDWNTQVNYTINGMYMGTTGQITSNPTISAAITDPDNENVSKMELFYGIPGSNNLPTVLTTVNNAATMTYTHSINVGAIYYYYLKITQSDGDIIWTSPIWIERIFGAAALELLDFKVVAKEDLVRVSWEAVVDGTGTFGVERSVNGIDFETLKVIPASGTNETMSFSFDDLNPVSGTGFYRIRWRENNGNTVLSPILSVYLYKSPIKLVALSPNPARDHITVNIDSKMTDDHLWYFLYNAAGIEVQRGTYGVVQGSNLMDIAMPQHPAGRYFLVLGRPGERMVETGFSKVE